jgi:hypothetical protein
MMMIMTITTMAATKKKMMAATPKNIWTTKVKETTAGPKKKGAQLPACPQHTAIVTIAVLQNL